MIRIIGSNRAKLNIMKEQSKNAVTEKLQYNLTECPMIGCHLLSILFQRQKTIECHMSLISEPVCRRQSHFTPCKEMLFSY